MPGGKENFSELVCELRNSFNAGKTRPLSYRKAQLKALGKMYEENSSEIVAALASDLRKPKTETLVMEINMLKDDIENLLKNVDKWAKPEIIPATSVTLFDKPKIYHDPFGVVLVLGAWNYPIQLPLLPVSGAIAAGNCVLIKPSEVSPATAALLKKIIPMYLDSDCVKVVTGGIEETTSLLEERFDYIFYTGSTNVGKIVRAAANKHLTPITLELGGKSPVYIDDSVNMDVAVRRILWGKLCNLGQTCVAPDYLLCSKFVQDKFISTAKNILKEFYGDDIKASSDLGRIVNVRHFHRLKELLSDGTAVVGGNYDESEKWIEPTILVDVDPKSKVMQDEIFGPILPIMNVDSATSAVNFINAREKPLALYVFSNSSKIQELFTNETSSGSVCVNDTILQLAVNGLPFGGVGQSGMGAYHGKFSYETFTHKKACLIRNYNKIAEHIGKNRYPPYTEEKRNKLQQMLKEKQFPNLRPFLSFLFAFGFGAISLYAIQIFYGNGNGF